MKKREKRIAKKRPIYDSVAVILRVGSEVLICQRQLRLTAFAGHWTFPGGRIDKADSLGEKLDLEYPKEQLNALVREAKEELEIDLAKDYQEGRITRITRMRTCVSPDFNPHRYQTHFYMVDYQKKPKLVFEEYEIKESWWTTPKDFLDKYNQGEILTVPPILYLMQDLCGIEVNYFPDAIPWTEMVKGLIQIMPKSVTLPPAERTNSFYIEGLLIDPSPKDDDEYQNFLKTLEYFKKPHKLMLTHHHPDHVQYAPEIAKHFGISMIMSQFTKDILIKKRGEAFFLNNKIEIIKDGDNVTSWMNHKVKVFEVPGHDEGHLALMPENKFWFIAGDLFQGIGSVVIPKVEGNMKKYMESLEKVIQLDPKVIVPSHGIPIGSTYVLKKLLKHRKKRLEQVRALYLKNKTPLEMRDEIYIELSHPLLRELALVNIEKNIELIEAEK